MFGWRSWCARLVEAQEELVRSRPQTPVDGCHAASDQSNRLSSNGLGRSSDTRAMEVRFFPSGPCSVRRNEKRAAEATRSTLFRAVYQRTKREMRRTREWLEPSESSESSASVVEFTCGPTELSETGLFASAPRL